MRMQQLDLFGSFDPPSAPAVKEQPREEKPVVVKESKENYSLAANAVPKAEEDKPAAAIFVSMPAKQAAEATMDELPPAVAPPDDVIFA
ncbi:MAG TPA: hypothetical protein VF145_09030, partial [Chitinophagaceae bacterium]